MATRREVGRKLSEIPYGSQNDNALDTNRQVQQWQDRVVHDRKVEVIKEIHKLELQIQSMEREKSTHIYSKRGDFYNDFKHLLEMETSYHEERSVEKEKLKQQLGRISSMVDKFRSELRVVQPTAAFVEKLKSTLEDVESTINAYKDQQRNRYDDLMASERLLSHEVGALQLKYDSWAKFLPVSPQKVKVTACASTARDVTVDLPEDVAVFEKFTQKTGGVRGGWDDYDHQIFLKLWLRHQTKTVDLLAALRSSIPTKSDEQIRDHVSWYREYTRLEECKKRAIQNWRSNKQIEKELITEQQYDETNEENKKKKRMQAVMESERTERVAKLNSWKVQKEIDRMNEEERKLRSELDKKQKWAEQRRRQLEVKSKVLEYKRQKDEDEAFLEQQRAAWAEEEESVWRQLSAREVSRFQERDQQKLNSKLQRKQEILDEEHRKKENLNKIKEEVSTCRDPSRLYRPTEGWKCRLNDTESSSATPSIHIPHRAVPSWRQNVT